MISKVTRGGGRGKGLTECTIYNPKAGGGPLTRNPDSTTTAATTGTKDPDPPINPSGGFGQARTGGGSATSVEEDPDPSGQCPVSALGLDKNCLGIRNENFIDEFGIFKYSRKYSLISENREDKVSQRGARMR